ncbi:hypothetical protein HXX76_012786 [Chlamydomonas incerta]|uniref:Beta-catenin-like protein 1 N-terminal domain-containing protein n=1 Tax=Chlamydomonas incerta TaxID=51695 RepID=A0A835VRX5_CHLIN|nr:hypothetical protein HXX76_012786 [Chlamydomonas incerta]|eukprot:KAG2427002.1 hypothetical protein HXX76_012786 [Chlamydomonas incerta]
MASNTAWVLSTALQGLAQPTGAGGKDFLPAARFTGAKPGYVFKVDEHGLGYYLDKSQAGEDAGAAEDKGAGGAGGSGEERAPTRPLDADELLRQAEEEANIDQIQVLDAKSLRRLVAGLDKKYKENMALRFKYAEQPDKFLDSEVDLDEHIKSLMQVAGSPELYPVLLDGPAIPTLLSLLSHENTDIAADTVELLAEMTGADAVEEYGDEARSLVEALVEANAPELLVQRLLGFKEADSDEEARAVHNCLAVVENLVEIQPELSSVFVERTKLLSWLLRRLKRREFDTNKQYASEILAILMQGSVSNQAKLGSENGIDLLLTCVAQYKSKDPAPGEEEEYMQNCFDVLCACLMQPEHKAAFVKAEGVELMHLMLQSRRQGRYGALKCLDFATTRYAPPAEKLVDLGGLKQMFGFFMGKAKVKGPAGEHDVDAEVEERCVSLVASLMAQLPATGRGAARRERLLAKFVEAEFEKTDRLMELLFRYQTRVRAEERRLMAAVAEAEEDEQVDEEELLLARLDAGLFTLQQCCVVFGNLWATGDVGLRRRLLGALHQKGQTLAPVREVLLEYYNSIGTEGGAEEAARARAHVRGLLEALGAELEEDGDEGVAVAAAGQPGGGADMAVEGEPGKDKRSSTQATVGTAPSGRPSEAARRDAELMPPPGATKPVAKATVPREEHSREQDKDRADRDKDRERRESSRRQRESELADRDRKVSSSGRDKERDRAGTREKDGVRELERERERDRDRERERDRDRDRGSRREERDRR